LVTGSKCPQASDETIIIAPRCHCAGLVERSEVNKKVRRELMKLWVVQNVIINGRKPSGARNFQIFEADE